MVLYGYVRESMQAGAVRGGPDGQCRRGSITKSYSDLKVNLILYAVSVYSFIENDHNIFRQRLKYTTADENNRLTARKTNTISFFPMN